MAELWVEFDAAAERRRAVMERDTILAYQGVRIYCKTMTDGRMPTLRSLLDPGRRQTPAEQRANVELIAAQFGLTMRPRTKKKAARRG